MTKSYLSRIALSVFVVVLLSPTASAASVDSLNRSELPYETNLLVFLNIEGFSGENGDQFDAVVNVTNAGITPALM